MSKEKQKAEIDAAICCGCSLCVVTCPFECLAISEPRRRGDIHTYAHLAKPEKCIGCRLCLNICPIDAIRMGSGAGGEEI